MRQNAFGQANLGYQVGSASWTHHVASADKNDAAAAGAAGAGAAGAGAGATATATATAAAAAAAATVNLTFSRGGQQMAFGPLWPGVCNNFFLEGIFEALSAPGEFYHDQAGKVSRPFTSHASVSRNLTSHSHV